MKVGTKSQFGTLVLVIPVAYWLWTETILGFLHIYSFTGNAHSIESKKAAIHFQKALYLHRIAPPLSLPEQRKWSETLELIANKQQEVPMINE